VHPVPSTPESVFTYGAPQLKFGPGASDEIGFDLAQYGVRRVLVVTDPGVAATGHPQRVADQMHRFGIEARVYAGAHVEPTDASLQAAVDAARDSGPWDAFVAVGGGSAIDTAKAVNLLTTNPGELMDYVNVPVGGGAAPSHPLAPLVAVPTTTGTGSESTTICVLDVLAQKVKTGISHARLRPTLAVVDPRLTLTQPAGVTAACGMDILCHALESWTARPYTSFEHKTPEQRVPYCGANPIADMWAERSLRLLADSFRTAVHHGDDEAARGQMALAATFAGMGFGNAGVHLPHANAYPVAGQVRDFHPAGYPDDHPMVPHGMAVSLTAPASFRFTFEADPERHVRAAQLLAPRAQRPSDDRDFLPGVLTELMRDIGIPNGLAAVGYGEHDVEELVAGTMKQQRLLATAPRPVTEDDVAAVLADSLELW
jgi:hydroxyacid-oxoacid transhydrogenase